MRLALAVTLLLLIPVVATGPSAPIDQPTVAPARVAAPVIESIEVVNAAPGERAAVLARIGVRAGDALTAEAKHRVGREIGLVREGMTFSYAPGLAPGTVRVKIDTSC